jgi:hypothetical protein
MATLSVLERSQLVVAFGSHATADHVADILDAVEALSSVEAGVIDGVTAGTWAASKACTLDASGDATLPDGCDLALNATTGTKIGTAVTQKLGFWNVTPVVQPASGDQADQGAMTTVGSNTGTSAAGLSLIGDTSTGDQSAALMNDLVALQEDIAALDTLVTAIRTALVDTGIMKGAA